MFRFAAMAILVGWSPVANAQDTSSEAMLRNGLRLARVGMVAGAAGSPVGALGGWAWIDGRRDGNGFKASVGRPAFLIGSTASLAGPPLIAMGSLRAQRGLAMEGVAVRRVHGHIAWGLWGAAVGMASLDLLFFDGLNTGPGQTAAMAGCFVGSYVFAGLQYRTVHRAWQRQLTVNVHPLTDGARIAFRIQLPRQR